MSSPCLFLKQKCTCVLKKEKKTTEDINIFLGLNHTIFILFMGRSGGFKKETFHSGHDAWPHKHWVKLDKKDVDNTVVMCDIRTENT